MSRGGVIIAALSFALTVVPGCKGEDDGGLTAAPAAEAAEVEEIQDDLLARRDALLAVRQEIDSKRQELTEKRASLRSDGVDTSEIDEALRLLDERDQQADAQAVELFERIETQLVKQRTVLAAAAGAGESMTAREAALAAREREIARREERLAKREGALSDREVGLAERWKDSCAVAAPTTTTIVRTVDSKGSSYTKKDVEPLLSRARREMNRRGVLASDLPPQARGLEDEATEAMAKGDYGRARFAAQQLVTTVRATRIDKGFIAAKIARLNQRIGGRKLAAATQKKIDALFRQATANYGDGEFSKANGSLNKIFASIR